MSLVAVNEILATHDQRKAVVEISKYVASLCESGEVDRLREPGVWSAAVKYLVGKVLVHVGGVRENNLRSLYSAPLKGIVTGLHAGCDKMAFDPPLSAGAVDLLYQHINSVLRLPSCKTAYSDYCATLNSLLRVSKYTSWLRPEVLETLTDALIAAMKACDGTTGQSLAVSLSTLVSCYPRTVTPYTASAVLEFSIEVIPHAASQHLILYTLRALNAAVRSVMRDMLPQIKNTLAILAPQIVKLIQPQGTMTEALRFESVEVLKSHLAVCHLTSLERTHANDIPNLDDMWVGLSYCVGVKTGASLRAEATLFDERNVALADLVSEVGCLVSERHLGVTNDTQLSEPKRRRKQHPWDMILTGLRNHHDLISWMWLKVLSGFVTKQAARDSTPVLSPDQLADGIDTLTTYLSKGGLAVSDTATAFALQTAAKMVDLPTFYTASPSPELVQSITGLKEHLTARVTGSVPNQTTGAAFEGLCSIFRLPSSFSQQDEDGLEAALSLAPFHTVAPPFDQCHAVELLTILLQRSSLRPPHLIYYLISAATGTPTPMPAIGLALSLITGTPPPPHPWLAPSQDSPPESTALLPTFKKALHETLLAVCDAEGATRVVRCCRLLGLLLSLRRAWDSDKAQFQKHCVSLLEVISTRWHRFEGAEGKQVLDALLEVLVHDDGAVAKAGVQELVGRLGGIARKLLHKVEAHLSKGEGDVAENAGDMLANVHSVAPVADNSSLLFKCTTAAIRRYSEISAETGELQLGPEVRQIVDKVWNVGRHGPVSFDLAEFLSVASDSRNVVSCLTKLRELLACKQNKWDDACISRTLAITEQAVRSTPSLEEAGVTDLLRDTIEKLTEIDTKGLVAPRSKVALCHAVMAIVPKAEGDLLSIALNSFLPLLSDPSYAVRLEAASFVATLVGLFEHPHGVFNSIVDKLAPHFAGKNNHGMKGCNTMAQTSIFAIAEIAKHSDTMQGTALLQLLLINTHKDFTEQAYLQVLLKEIAKNAGAADTLELITWHIPFLLRGWVICKQLPLKSFPYTLLGCKYYADFIEKHMCFVFPAVLQSDDRAALVNHVCSAISGDETELLVRHMADVFGQVYLNYYDPSVVRTAKAVCEEYVKGKLSDQRLSIVLEQNIYDILKVFVSLESSREDCELPKVHSSVVDRAFTDFAGLWGRKDSANFLASTPDCVYKLLLFLGVEVLQKKRLIAWRCDRFRVMLRLLGRCSPRTLSSSHVFKLTTHLCIVAACTMPDTQEEALAELCKLCISTVTCSPLVLARHLSDIVTRLMPLVKDVGQPSRPTPTRAASPVLGDSESDDVMEEPKPKPAAPECITLQAINKVLACAHGSKECRKALTQTVNPFPADGKYASCNKMYDRLSGGLDCGWADYMKALKENSRSSVRCAVLRRLTDSVTENKEYCKDEDSTVLMEHLVEMCCSLGDTDVRLSAVEAVAAMQGAGHNVSVVWSNTLQELPLPKEDDWELPDFMRLGRLAVLQELVNSVCGTDHEAVLAASETLLQVLAVDFNATTALIQTATPLLKDDLVPFCPSAKKVKGLKANADVIKTPTFDALQLRVQKAAKHLRDALTWDPSKPYDVWVSNVTCGLLHNGVDDVFFQRCAGACLLVPSVAHTLLPYVLVDLCLAQRKKKKDVNEIAELQQFVAAQCDAVFRKAGRHPQHARVLLQAIAAVKAVQTAEVARVGIADEMKTGGLRLATRPGVVPVWVAKLDMQVVAEAALRCGAQVTAMRFAEQCLDRREGGLVCLHQEAWSWEDNEVDTNMVLNQIMATASVKRSMSQITPKQGKGCRPSRGYHDTKRRMCADEMSYRKLLVDIANEAGDTDQLKGVDDGSEPAFRLCHYEREGEWLRALGCCDAEYGGGDSQVLKRVLRGNGMHGVLSWGLQSARRLTQWGDIGQDATQGFPHYITSCLAGLEGENAAAFEASVRDAKASVAEELLKGKQLLETCIARTKCVKLLEGCWGVMWGDGRGPPEDDDLHKIGILDCSVSTPATLHIPDAVMPHLLGKELVKIVGREDVGVRKIEDAVRVMGKDVNAGLALIHRSRQGVAVLPPEVDLMEASLLRERGEKAAAVSTLKKLAITLKTDKTKRRLLAATLCNLGKWVGEDTAETRTDIINKYLTPAAQLVGGEDCKERADVFYTLGRFLDKLYVALSTREVTASTKLMEEARGKYQECHQYLKANRGKLSSVNEKVIERTSHHLGVISSKVNEEEGKLQTDQEVYLLQSIKAYCMVSVYSDEYDLISVFRLVALWLQNDANSELNHYLTGFFGKSAVSAKFIPLAYQLVSRISVQKSDSCTFQPTLSVLLEKLARDHPHHALPHLLALSQGDYLPDHQRYKEVFIPDTGKINAAKQLLKNISRSKTLAPLVVELRKLSEAYMEFAFHPINKKTHADGEKILLSQKLALKSIRSLDHAMVPTHDLPVQRSGGYTTIPRVKEFEPCYTTAGGINLPKIIRCLGSDGKWYKQLVKGGQDDLRQDAVLEQFFGLCNDLLKLVSVNMRTYKVIPLSPTSGIVQWVNDTVPMGEWLLRRTDPTKGAHRRYHPTDMTYKDARIALSDQSMNAKDKRAAFKEICNNFTPVLHHFFLETYPDAVRWLHGRQAYTKSTAAASIIGYIVGLGDRHSQNILIDTKTGEVIHIDLGVAFEKGKFLPVPELVPFRLTRDIIDGMGITGTEGLFRNTAETCLVVLQQSKQLLQTITEVFIHDPLYNYSLDPAKVMHKQSEFSSKKIKAAQKDAGHKVNPDAELALMRVKEKLDGYEDGEHLSADGQVNKLIRSASSLDTLAVMYVGWAAWM